MYKYWKWHGLLCRYAVTDLVTDSTQNVEVAGDEQEGVLLIHGFGASGSQWNKAMQESVGKASSFLHFVHVGFLLHRLLQRNCPWNAQVGFVCRGRKQYRRIHKYLCGS
jgi:hypothetical protein